MTPRELIDATLKPFAGVTQIDLVGHSMGGLVIRAWLRAYQADARIGRYRVDVENFESIHNHSAWARIERD